MCYGKNAFEKSSAPVSKIKRHTELVYLIPLIFHVASMLIIPAKADTEILYEYLDNITADTFVGSVKHDAKLHRRYSDNELNSFYFIFVPETVHKEDQQYFRLRSQTGAIYTTQLVDRDEICPNKITCYLHLTIAVQPTEHFQLIRVVIILHDDNDNAPTFDNAVIDFSIEEVVPVGMLLFLPPAIDNDSPDNGIHKYELIDDLETFDIDLAPNGDVRLLLLKSLNREVLDFHRLTVMATDGGIPPRSGNMTVNIYVTDVNDNSPRFIDPAMEISVTEDTLRGSVLTYLNAMDLDQGENGRLHYNFSNTTELLHGSVFKLNSRTGKIILTKDLDREETAHYVLEVIAQDSGENSIPAESKIFINVLDVNDNAPMIVVGPLVHDNNTLLVMESDESNRFVGHVSVQDIDEGDNGRVACSLQDTVTEQFQLVPLYDAEYKIVSRKSLHRAVQDVYVFFIACHDFGSLQLSSETLLRVVVADKNDYTPQFEKDIYSTAVFENTRVKGSLLVVKAVEPESGLNGQIEYSLGREAGSVFKINQTTGAIITVTSFNREEIGNTVEFRVFAADTGFMPQTATATVQIAILDVDDEPPMFAQHKYIFNIYENMPPDTIIGVVNAHDKDLPPHTDFSFHLDSSKTNTSFFQIDSKTGLIRSKVSYDREKRAIYDIIVRVQGEGNPQHFDEALVQVYITDINDNAPNITYPNNFDNKIYVSSTSKHGVEFSSVIAHDPDQGVNGMLTYQFSNDSSPLFAIAENTGKIYIKGDLSEFVHELFEVKAIVMDKGTPQLVSKVVFKIIASNKLSQTDTWDKYQEEKDRGLAMEDRVSIILFVVLMSMVSIIILSIATRVYFLRQKVTETLYGPEYTESDYSHTNGFIPSRSSRSIASSAEYSSVPNEEVYYVKSRKRSSVGSSVHNSTTAKDSPSEDKASNPSEVPSDTADGQSTEDPLLNGAVSHHTSEDSNSPSSPANRRKSVHFEDGFEYLTTAPTIPSSPSTIFCETDLGRARFKHAIPGVCTIIAASEEDIFNLTDDAHSYKKHSFNSKLPNENILRYSQSLALERGYSKCNSPPPIPKHIPPPICISASPRLISPRNFRAMNRRGENGGPPSITNVVLLNSRRLPIYISHASPIDKERRRMNGRPRGNSDSMALAHLSLRGRRSVPTLPDYRRDNDDSDGSYI